MKFTQTVREMHRKPHSQKLLLLKILSENLVLYVYSPKGTKTRMEAK